MHENLTRLGGLYSHLIKESNNPQPDVVSVVIDLDMTAPERQPYQMPPTLIPELLHGLLLTFRLGIESSIKLVHTPSKTLNPNRQSCSPCISSNKRLNRKVP